MKEDTFKEVKEIIGEVIERKPEDIKNTDNLITDLQLESLDIVSLVGSFEEKYGIEILDKDIKSLVTVQDIVEYIENHV